MSAPPTGHATAWRGRFFENFGVGWWILNVLSTVLLGGTVWAAHLHQPAWWVELAIIGAFCFWLVHLLEYWIPRIAVWALVPFLLLSAAMVGPSGGSTMVMACVAMLIFSSRAVVRGRGIALAFAAGVLVTAVSIRSIGGTWTEVGVNLMGLLLVAMVGLNRRTNEQRAAQTARLLEQTRRAQAEHARAAALDERARIARELHDVLAHSLGGLRIQLEVAEALLAEEGDVDGALARVRRSRRLALDGMAEARSAVSALRADVVPLPEALEAEVATYRADHGTAAEFRLTGGVRPLSPGAEVSLLRTAREALTNAARHAPGAALDVLLAYDESAVRLVVRNGPPPGPVGVVEEGGGFGLVGMRERLALVGGALGAGPAGVDGQGWLVNAEVPE